VITSYVYLSVAVLCGTVLSARRMSADVGAAYSKKIV